MKQTCIDGRVFDESEIASVQEADTGYSFLTCGDKCCANYGCCDMEAAHECKVCGEVKAASENPNLSYEGYCAACVKQAEMQMQAFLESWALRECFEAVHGNPLDSYA